MLDSVSQKHEGAEMGMDAGATQDRDPEVVYHFGLYTLERTSGTLTRNGIRVHLQDQPLRFLLLLLEKHGSIVAREEIQQRLWPGNTFVDFDKSLGVVVLKVREALRDSASNPSFVETVPRRGYRFIAPVSISRIERSAAPFVGPLPIQEAALAAGPPPTALEARPSAAEPSPLKTPRPLRHRLSGYAVAALVFIAASTAALMVWMHRSSGELGSQQVSAKPASVVSSTPRMRRSVAVLGFRNLTTRADQNWLSAAFTEMLNTELAASPDLRLVSGEDVADVKRDLGLPEEDTLSHSTLQRLRENLGADVIVLGSYALLPDNGKNRLRLDIRMQDTVAGETIAQEAFTGNQNELFDLAGHAGNRLRETLQPSEALAPSGPQPPPHAANQLALQFYSEGRARLLGFDFVGARDFLKRAIYADPHYAMAHSALASTFWHLGDDAHARREAKLAVDQSQHLPDEFALAIRGQYEEILLDWAAASKTYAALAGLFPDNLDYGLRLANAQFHLDSDDALRTLASLRRLPAPVGTDPRIDLINATVLIGRDLRSARLAAQQAIAKATVQGSTLMIARGYGILCQQDAGLGAAFDHSIQECGRARSSYLAAGDLNNAARTQNDMAGLYYESGKLSEAESMWRQAITEFRRVDEQEGLGASSNNLGDIYLVRGRLRQADQLLHQAILSYQRTKDADGVAGALVDLGDLCLHRGDLSGALENFHRSLQHAGSNGDKSVVAAALAGIGETKLQQSDVRAARTSYESAWRLRQELGEKQAIAQTELALAKIRILEGNPADAESRARRCKAQFHLEQQADDELAAGLVVVDSLIAQTKIPEAVAEFGALQPIATRTQNHVLQLRYLLHKVRLAQENGDGQTARRGVAATLMQARSEGYVDIQKEALRLQARSVPSQTISTLNHKVLSQ
jgi:DNA-binding winged helix-turn-helix (wHTH) protein/tetratricopeptide (TPR) repeat protein